MRCSLTFLADAGISIPSPARHIADLPHHRTPTFPHRVLHTPRRRSYGKVSYPAHIVYTNILYRRLGVVFAVIATEPRRVARISIVYK